MILLCAGVMETFARRMFVFFHSLSGSFLCLTLIIMGIEACLSVSVVGSFVVLDIVAVPCLVPGMVCKVQG